MNKNIFQNKIANSIHLNETIDGIAEKSISSNLRDYQIFGNTENYQNNLLDMQAHPYSPSRSTLDDEGGLSCIQNEDGTLTVSGTLINTATFKSGFYNKTLILKAGSYRILTSGCGIFCLNLRKVKGDTQLQIQTTKNNLYSYDFVLWEDYYLYQWFYYFPTALAGTTFETTFYPTITQNFHLKEWTPYSAVGEVMSVGDKSGNLIYPLKTQLYSKFTHIVAANLATVSVDVEDHKITVVNGSSKWGCARIPCELIKGRTYTFSAKIDEINSSTGVQAYISGNLFNSGAAIWSSVKKKVGDVLSVTFTVEKEIMSMASDNTAGSFVALYPMGADGEKATVTFSEVTLIEGTPEKPYSIPVFATGKNLVDITEYNVYNPNGSFYHPKVTVEGSSLTVTATNGSAVQPCIFHCKVPKGKQITVSSTNISCSENANTSNTQIRCYFTNNPKDTLYTMQGNGHVMYNLYNGRNNVSEKLTLTVGAEYLVIAIRVQNNMASITIDNLQVEIGDKQTSYEPYYGFDKALYLSEPLHENEYIDFRTQKIYRNGSEEDIELPRLPQYKGKTIYQTATNIPSEFVGTYKTRL